MIVSNITTKVKWDILEGWIAWQLDEQIPAILRTECFDDFQFYRLLDQEEDDGPTFVLQLSTAERERYEQFLNGFLPGLQQAAWDKWGNDFIAFRTLMERIR